jgi:glycine cleavage system H protein
MSKMKVVRLQQELVEEIKNEVKKSQYPSLSEFVSEAIRLRLQTLTKQRIQEYIERDEQSRIVQVQGQLLYTPKHVWVKVTTKGNVQLGISDYFESQLKGIVYVGNFVEGDNVYEDKPFGTVETIGGWPLVINDLYSPIDGKIVKVNKAVINDPYILNGNPHQWIVEIQPNSPEFNRELDKLMSFEEYQKNRSLNLKSITAHSLVTQNQVK